MAIAHRISNDSGEAWPSIDTLAHEAKLSRSAVKVAIQNLIKMGELEITRGGNGAKDTHTYRFPHFLVWMEDLQTNKMSKSDPLSAGIGLKSGLFKGSDRVYKRSESGERRPKSGPEPSEPSTRATVNNSENLTPASTDVPVDWIPLPLWTAFREMRIRIKKPMSDSVVDLLIRRLQKLKNDGNDVIEVIE
jgi:hypothetical protein